MDTQTNKDTEKNPATYLNDHLAGSVAALDLLGQMEKAHGGTDLGSVLAALRADIAKDRRSSRR